MSTRSPTHTAGQTAVLQFVCGRILILYSCTPPLCSMLPDPDADQVVILRRIQERLARCAAAAVWAVGRLLVLCSRRRADVPLLPPSRVVPRGMRSW